MGKYDGPYFKCEERDVVSIWVAHAAFADIPEDYWQPNFGSENDDDPWNKFSSDFGFGYYDDDFVEAYCQDDHSVVPLHEQLKYLSYSSSFIEEAVQEAKRKGLENTCYVFLIYNFEYDPGETGIHSSETLTFLGAFPFDAV